MNVNYYAEGRKYEPIKVIRDWELNFALGSAVKYIARAGRKTDSKVEDLRKAIDYLQDELNNELNNEVENKMISEIRAFMDDGK